MPPVFNGRPEEQLLPYLISTDLSELSKRTKSRLSLQLHLKPQVLRQKRWQITPPAPSVDVTPQAWGGFIADQTHRSSVYAQLMWLMCLKICIFQNLSRDRQSQTIGGEEARGNRLWGHQHSHVTWIKLQVIAFPKLCEMPGERNDMQHHPLKHHLPAFGVSISFKACCTGYNMF